MKIKFGMIGLVLFAWTSTASAVTYTVTACVGVGTPTCPGAVEEEFVFYNTVNGTVIGNIGSQTGQPTFTISSQDGILATQGFSQLNPGTASTNDVTFLANGFTFGDLIFALRGTGTVTITDQSGATPTNGTIALDPGIDAFIALATDGAFTSLTFTTTGSFLQIGQVRVSEIGVIPLPGAALLFASGLAGLALLMRRRRQPATAA